MYWNTVINDLNNKGRESAFIINMVESGGDTEIAKPRSANSACSTRSKSPSSRERYQLDEQHPGRYLTRRELECVYYMTRGNTGKRVAAILNLSVRTVESYIENIKSKFGCNTKCALINLVLESGLLEQIGSI